jgi:hypothetical protein
MWWQWPIDSPARPADTRHARGWSTSRCAYIERETLTLVVGEPRVRDPLTELEPAQSIRCDGATGCGSGMGYRLEGVEADSSDGGENGREDADQR